MNYEAVDWELEAARVRRAFGIEEAIEFELTKDGQYTNFTDNHNLFAEIWYSEKGVHITYPAFNGSFSHKSNWISINYTGEVRSYSKGEYTDRLLRALHRLGYLFPAVEKVFGVAISAHEKMEWELEYEARLKGVTT